MRGTSTKHLSSPDDPAPSCARSLADLPLFRNYTRAFKNTTGLALKLVPPDGPSHCRHRFCELLDHGGVCRYANDIPATTSDTEIVTRACFAGFHDGRIAIRNGINNLGFLITDEITTTRATQARFEDIIGFLNDRNISFNEEALHQLYFSTPVISLARYHGILDLLAIFAGHLALIAGQLVLRGDHSEAPAIARARKYINDHIAEPLDLKQVAERAHLSSCYFCKRFKESTGFTFTEYVARARVEAAKNLLIRPQVRVSEVAFEVGFQSLTHFNRVFKQIEGQSHPLPGKPAEGVAPTPRQTLPTDLRNGQHPAKTGKRIAARSGMFFTMKTLPFHKAAFLAILLYAAPALTAQNTDETKDPTGFTSKMKDWQDEMSEKFSDTFNELRKELKRSGHMVSVDLREKNDSYVIRLNLPDRDLQKTEVKLEGNTLSIVAPAEGNVSRYEQTLVLSGLAADAKPVIERKQDEDLMIVTVSKAVAAGTPQAAAEKDDRTILDRMDTMRRDMDRIFQEAFEDFRLTPEHRDLFDESRFGSSVVLQDEGENYIVRAYLPGRDLKDLNVTVENQTLKIEAKAEATDHTKPEGATSSYKAQYSQFLALPGPVKVDQMKVDRKDEMVIVTLPKAPATN